MPECPRQIVSLADYEANWITEIISWGTDHTGQNKGRPFATTCQWHGGCALIPWKDNTIVNDFLSLQPACKLCARGGRRDKWPPPLLRYIRPMTPARFVKNVALHGWEGKCSLHGRSEECEKGGDVLVSIMRKLIHWRRRRRDKTNKNTLTNIHKEHLVQKHLSM